jgi:hypothetical protein
MYEKNCEQVNLKSIILQGESQIMPNSKTKLLIKYTLKEVRKEIYDPVLSFQLSNDFHELRVLKITYWVMLSL